MTRSGWQSTEALRNLARIFTETGGDAAAIAVLCRGGWECLFSSESFAADPPANAEDFAIKFSAGAYYPQRAARERRTGTAHGNGATGSAGSAPLTYTAALFETPIDVYGRLF